MKIEIENTSKIVTLNGVPARIWEGKTSTGTKVHCFITRIAIADTESDKTKEEFNKELQSQKAPSADIEKYPIRMII